MRIHLHQDFLIWVTLFDVFAKSQPGLGKMAHIDNNEIVSACRNNSAGCLKISGCIHVMAFHAQHKRTQMLHRGITIHEQYSGIAFGTGHGEPFPLSSLGVVPEYTASSSEEWPIRLSHT